MITRMWCDALEWAVFCFISPPEAPRGVNAPRKPPTEWMPDGTQSHPTSIKLGAS